MKQLFWSLSRRDQTALLVLVVVLGLWLVLKFGLGSVAEKRASSALNNSRAAALSARVDAKAAALEALRSEEGTRAARGSITAQVSRSSEAAGLPIARLQPNSRGEVQVRFEAVDFDVLLEWLAQLEREQQLTVVDASISQGGRSGGVNATLRLAGAQ